MLFAGVLVALLRSRADWARGVAYAAPVLTVTQDIPAQTLIGRGVEVVVAPNGNLRITPGPTISSDFTVSWTVQDGRGGTATVAVTVSVGCDDLPSTGSDPLQWVRIAVLAIAAGAVLTIVSRRRWRRAG